MITFKQFLAENPGYPLYHATGFGNLLSILNSNILRGGYGDDRHWPAAKRGYSMISMTRSFKFASEWDSVVIEFDRAKLKQRYKVVPFNYFADELGTARVPHSRRFWDYGNLDVNQYEEAVVGDIKDVSKYIKAIYLQHKHMIKIKEETPQLYTQWKYKLYPLTK